MSAFGTRRIGGYVNNTAGTVLQGTPQPTIVPVFETDTSPFWRFLGIAAIAIAAFFIVVWIGNAIVADRNWTACEKGGTLCPEFARGDREIAKQARTDAQALAILHAAKAKEDAEQAAKLAADILARPRKIYGVNIPETEVIMSGGGKRSGVGGAVNPHHGSASWTQVCTCLQALGLVEGADFFSTTETDGRPHARLTDAGKAKVDARVGGLAAASACLR